MSINIGVIGEGVVGLSTALAIRQNFPASKVTLFSDRPFIETSSYGPAGIFRVDSSLPRYQHWATQTFKFWAQLAKECDPTKTGVQMLSGHIQSDNRNLLESQERAMSNIVHNFSWIGERELSSIFANPKKYGIHFTSYAAEGRRYVPWLREQLVETGSVDFKQQKLDSIQQLLDNGQFSLVLNCAGLGGGKLAGDDDTLYPNRGVALEVIAPGQSQHFVYHDLDTFCLPLIGNDRLLLGTLRQDNKWEKEVTEQDKEDIFQRILKMKPSLKNCQFVGAWCGLRPFRPAGVRLEYKSMGRKNGKDVHVIHNYGHASNGFLLSRGCAQDVVNMIKEKGICSEEVKNKL